MSEGMNRIVKVVANFSWGDSRQSLSDKFDISTALSTINTEKDKFARGQEKTEMRLTLRQVNASRWECYPKCCVTRDMEGVDVSTFAAKLEAELIAFLTAEGATNITIEKVI